MKYKDIYKRIYFVIIILFITSAVYTNESYEYFAGSISIELGYNHFNKTSFFRNSGLFLSSFMSNKGTTPYFDFEGFHSVFTINEKNSKKTYFDIIKYSLSKDSHNLILGDNNLFFTEYGINNTRIRGLSYNNYIFGLFDFDIFAGRTNKPKLKHFFDYEREYDRYITGFNLNHNYNDKNIIDFTFYHSEDDPSTVKDLQNNITPIKNTLFSVSNYYDANEKVDIVFDGAYSFYNPDKKNDNQRTYKSIAYKYLIKYKYTENLFFDFYYKNKQNNFYSFSSKSNRRGRNGFFSDAVLFGDNYATNFSVNFYSDKNNDLTEKNRYFNLDVRNEVYFIQNRTLTFDYRYMKNDFVSADTEFITNSFGIKMKDNIMSAHVTYSFKYITNSDKSNTIFANNDNEIYNLSLYLRDYLFSDKLYYNLYILSSTQSGSVYKDNFFLKTLNINYFYSNKLFFDFYNEYSIKKSSIQKEKEFNFGVSANYYIDNYETLTLNINNNYNTTNKLSRNYFNISFNYEIIF